MPPAPSTGTCDRPTGVAIGRMCRICSRCCGVSMKPPLPGVDASRKLSGETSCELPVVSTIWASVRPFFFSLAGSTCTCSWCSRWPQMATFATPWTPSSRGLIVHRASTPSSVGDRVSEESPTSITRPAEESGCSIAGGFETFGRMCARVSRSCTSCRASSRSVSGSKMSKTDESPSTDSERIVWIPATPFSRSPSSGTVISSSTSAADRPSASVWMATYGGENSGRSSTGASRSCITPTTSVPMAASTTRSRNRKAQSIRPRTKDLPRPSAAERTRRHPRRRSSQLQPDVNQMETMC